MPSEATYEPLNGSASRLHSWNALTSTEKKLIILLVIETVLLAVFGIAFVVALKGHNDCLISTTSETIPTTSVTVPSTTHETTTKPSPSSGTTTKNPDSITEVTTELTSPASSANTKKPVSITDLTDSPADPPAAVESELLPANDSISVSEQPSSTYAPSDSNSVYS